MSGFDTEQLHGLGSFSGQLGIRLAAAEPTSVRLELDWRAALCTAGGVLHGGALMSLADTAGAVCAFLNLPEGAQGTTTIESKTNLLNAVRGGTVSAVATPLPTSVRISPVSITTRPSPCWSRDRGAGARLSASARR